MRIFCVFIVLLISTLAEAQTLRIMTYNIRFDNPQDSVNAWPNRKQKVFNLLKKYDADIIGLQEALLHQITDITGALNGYEFVGVGRDDGKQKGEYSPIVYKKDKLEVVDQNTFWLSENPQQPGSKSWDAAITRIATWILFKDKQTGRKFLCINTHFDHIGTEARKHSAEILKAKASEIGSDFPIVITGDFNCTRDEAPYKIMTDGEFLELIDPASQPEGTYCTFKVNGAECRAIDYIFVSSEWRTDKYTVIKDNDGKYYPSDHLPVMLTISPMD
jgi:endonuclease/exonuclease/phosphatase family metal-dependent hydrolase